MENRHIAGPDCKEGDQQGQEDGFGLLVLHELDDIAKDHRKDSRGHRPDQNQGRIIAVNAQQDKGTQPTSPYQGGQSGCSDNHDSCRPNARHKNGHGQGQLKFFQLFPLGHPKGCRCFFQIRVNLCQSCQGSLQNRKDRIDDQGHHSWQGPNTHERNKETQESQRWNGLKNSSDLQAPLGQALFIGQEQTQRNRDGNSDNQGEQGNPQVLKEGCQPLSLSFYKGLD